MTGIRFLKEKLGGHLSDATAENMEMILSSVEAAKETDFQIRFTPPPWCGASSYYTGTIFEVVMG